MAGDELRRYLLGRAGSAASLSLFERGQVVSELIIHRFRAPLSVVRVQFARPEHGQNENGPAHPADLPAPACAPQEILLAAGFPAAATYWESRLFYPPVPAGLLIDLLAAWEAVDIVDFEQRRDAFSGAYSRCPVSLSVPGWCIVKWFAQDPEAAGLLPDSLVECLKHRESGKGDAGPSRSGERRAKTTGLTKGVETTNLAVLIAHAEAVMLDYVAAERKLRKDPKFRVKRPSLIEACERAGYTWRIAVAAYRKLPEDHRFRRGGTKKQ